jgi:hypothetical protein
VQDNFVLEEFVLGMFPGESTVFRDLVDLCVTSRPYGFRKKSRCISALARILRAILGIKVVITINYKISKSQPNHSRTERIKNIGIVGHSVLLFFLGLRLDVLLCFV